MSESERHRPPPIEAVALDELLKDRLPEGISALNEEHRQDLAELVGQARRDHVEELVQAADSALDSLPGFLAGAVRRAAGL